VRLHHQTAIPSTGARVRPPLADLPGRQLPSVVDRALQSDGEPLDAGLVRSVSARLGRDLSRMAVHHAPTATSLVSDPSDPEEREATRIASTGGESPLDDRLPAAVASTPVPRPRGDLDLSRVRVHADSQGATAALALHAQAFTYGSHVFFGAGRYAPATTDGYRLLVHEVAHVAQGDNGSVLHRDVQSDKAGKPVAFEFRVGTELTLPFAALAKRLAADGRIDDGDLRQLRDHALSLRGTVNDLERMFMAGLLDPANAAAVKGAAVKAGASIVFPIVSISTTRLQHVVDLDRRGVPAGVTTALSQSVTAFSSLQPLQGIKRLSEAEAAASAEITAVTDTAPKREREALIAFAQARGVFLSGILRAMLAAASDNSPSDRLFAGIVYAVAQADGHPMAGDVLAGRVKVDALTPQAFARLPGLLGDEQALYVTAPQSSGLKGDTVYVQTTLDILSVLDRSMVIHELQHAQDDKAVAPPSPPRFPLKTQLELAGYRAQAAYVLQQMRALDATGQALMASQVTARTNALLLAALVLEAHSDPARYEPLLVMIFAAEKSATFHRSAAQVKQLLGVPSATIEAAILKDIEAGYKLAPGATGALEGLAGESLIHLLFRP
jgi:hypothetical protein